MPIRTLAASVCIVALNAGCGAATPAIVQCKIAAVEKLPEDPLAINGHDVSNLVARLQNCKSSTADGGAP